MANLPLEKNATKSSRLQEAWFQSARPFLAAIFGTILLFLPIYQSFTAVCKYLKEPKNTAVDFEDFTLQETPWITICPVPQFNFAKMEEYVLGLTNGSVKRFVGLTEGLSPAQFAMYPAFFNMTTEEFINSVGTPLWTNLVKCNLNTNGGAGEAWRLCGFSGFEEEPTHGSSRIILDKNEPMLVHTTRASWESRFYLNRNRDVMVCSTFQPEFDANFNYIEVKFSLRHILKTQYATQNRYLQLLLSNGLWLPTYQVYLTQPMVLLDENTGIVEGSPAFQMTVGQETSVEISAEKYKSLKTSENPCLHGDQELLEADACKTKCFEATLLGDICRIPGYRNESLFTEYKNVRICKTEEDFTGLVAIRVPGLADSPQSVEVLRKCIQQCSAKPCKRIEYNWSPVISATNAYASRDMKNFTNIWEDDRIKWTKLTLIFKQRSVRVFEQTYAYDIWALLGEIGGTWGLFLGLSFIHVFLFFEQVALAMLNRKG